MQYIPKLLVGCCLFIPMGPHTGDDIPEVPLDSYLNPFVAEISHSRTSKASHNLIELIVSLALDNLFALGVLTHIFLGEKSLGC